MKSVVQTGITVLQSTIFLAGLVHHVNCLAVVSASVNLWTPAFVLPGVLARYRRRANGKWGTQQIGSPTQLYVYIGSCWG